MIGIKIPQLDLTMQSAKLVRWEFKHGTEVKEGQIILVIETDKVTSEVSSIYLRIYISSIRQG